MTAAAESVAGADCAEWTFIAAPASVATARRHLAAWLAGRCPRPLAGDAVTVLSELVGNAVTHTGSRRVRVRCNFATDTLRIAVSDGSRELPVCLLDVNDHLDEHGRGLLIVDALCTRWGVTGEPRGKTVWADLPTGRSKSHSPQNL